MNLLTDPQVWASDVHSENFGLCAFILGLRQTTMDPKRKERGARFCLHSDLPFLGEGHFYSATTILGSLTLRPIFGAPASAGYCCGSTFYLIPKSCHLPSLHLF